MPYRLLAVLCTVALIAGCSPSNENAAEENTDTAVGAELQGVAFTYVKEQAIFEVHINGYGPYNFFIDTGGDPCLIDLETAKEAGVPLDLGESGEAEGLGSGSAKLFAGEITNLEIGGHKFGDFEAVAMDLDRFSKSLGTELHGMLGVNFLRDRVTVFDYVNRRLTFPDAVPNADYTEYGLLENSYVVPLVFRENDTIPVFDGLTISDEELKVSLDTGSNASLVLYPWAVERLNLAEQFASGEEGSVQGARGSVTTRRSTLNNISLRGMAFPEILVTSRANKNQPESEDGKVGTPLLKDFRLTLDYANGYILFEKMK